MRAKRGTHAPAWQPHDPPQSRVPPRHSPVQLTAEQLGRCPTGTHAVGWQHDSGSQSLSTAHAPPAPESLPITDPPPPTRGGGVVLECTGGGAGAGAGEHAGAAASSAESTAAKRARGGFIARER
jgi:hypothetical protein